MAKDTNRYGRKVNHRRYPRPAIGPAGEPIRGLRAVGDLFRQIGHRIKGGK